MRLDNDSSKNTTRPRPASNGVSFSPSSKNAQTNGSSKSHSESNGSVAIQTNGVSNGHQAGLPSFFGHDREEVTRLLIQSLNDLGYYVAATQLTRESGFELEGPDVAAFRDAVLKGDWPKAEAILFGYEEEQPATNVENGLTTEEKGRSRSPRRSRGLTLAEGANTSLMLFWIRQQKYLELLEARDLPSALKVLRQELTPLHQDVSWLHALSRYASHQQ